MKKLFGIFVLALAVGLISLSQLAFAGNLFVDPGFDINGTNDWSQMDTPFQGTDETYHSAPYCAKNVVNGVSGNDFFGEIYQLVAPFYQGDPVYMTGFLKTNLVTGTTARAGIQVEFLDSANQLIPDTNIKSEIAGVNDWVQVFVSGYAPAGTAKIRAGAFLYAQKDDTAAIGSVAYADDMFIDKIAAPGDLIINPGFESLLSGWINDATAHPFDYTAAVQHSGTYSAADTVDTVANQNYYGHMYQERSFAPGVPIYAAAWGKSDISELSSAKGGLIVEFYNGTTFLSKLFSEIGGRTDWRRLYVAGIAPAGTTKIRIGAYLWALQGDTSALTGRFYIDDFEASTTPITPPSPPTDLINADFENGVNDWLVVSRPFTATNTVKHSGSFAGQHFVGITPSDGYWAQIYQDLPISPGQTAFISGWGKTEFNVISGVVGGILLQFYDGQGNYLGSQYDRKGEAVNGNANWQSLYASIMAPANAAKVRVSAYVWGPADKTVNASFYVDDMTFSNVAPEGLILNPGFEDGFSGWTGDGTGTPMTISTQEYHSGTQAAQATISQPTGGADYWSRVYQETATITTGHTLYATLWAKTNIPANSTASAGIKIEFINNLGQPIGAAPQSVIQGQTDWTYLYVTGTAPTGTVRARVSVFATCPNAAAALGGFAYFDDIVASETALPPPNFPTALANPGYEGGLSGWTDLYGPPTQLDNTAHSGTYSAKKTIVAIPNQNYFSMIYQDIYYNAQGNPFPANQNVYITAYLKTNIDPTALAQAGIRVEYFDAGDVPYEIGAQQINAINDWRQLYIAATIPAGARKVRVSGFAFAPLGDTPSLNGTVNFDDFVYQYTQIPPPPLPTVLQNTGFENGLNYWEDFYRPAVVTTEYAHGGAYSARFLIDDVQADAFRGELRQEIACAAGQQVNASAWAKTIINVLSPASAALEVVFMDAQGHFLNVLTQSTGGTTAPPGWVQLQVAGTAPSNTTKVRFICSLNAQRFDPYATGGKGYFDDAALTITTPPPPPPHGCFLAGTPITMADGSTKLIEKIKVGDMVLAYNEAAQKMQPDKVTQLFRHPKEGVYLIVNSHLKVTPIHRVLSKGKWIEIGKLQVGDSLTNTKGENVAIKSIVKVIEPVDIYNFEVNPLHTYVAGGYVVHNRKNALYSIKLSDDGPLTARKEQVFAEE